MTDLTRRKITRPLQPLNSHYLRTIHLRDDARESWYPSTKAVGVEQSKELPSTPASICGEALALSAAKPP